MARAHGLQPKGQVVIMSICKKAYPVSSYPLSRVIVSHFARLQLITFTEYLIGGGGVFGT